MKHLTNSEVKNIWQQVCADLQPQVTPSNYGTWILANPITGISYPDSLSLIATVTSPTSFHLINFKKNFHSDLEKCLTTITQRQIQLKYQVGEPTRPEPQSQQITQVADMIPSPTPNSSLQSPHITPDTSPSLQKYCCNTITTS